jgi:hypothetical protein
MLLKFGGYARRELFEIRRQAGEESLTYRGITGSFRRYTPRMFLECKAEEGINEGSGHHTNSGDVWRPKRGSKTKPGFEIRRQDGDESWKYRGITGSLRHIYSPEDVADEQTNDVIGHSGAGA